MEEKFDLILDDDEKIVGILRPDKTKLVFSTVLGCLFVAILLCFPVIGVCFDETDVVPSWIWVVPVAAFVVVSVVGAVVAALYYNKTYYAYTTKRLVIRTGIVGTDYKSLDMKTVGAINVNVGLIDKILRKNTGSLRFGSMSSPINGQSATFNFSHITAPYENYKKIKEYIETSREK